MSLATTPATGALTPSATGDTAPHPDHLATKPLTQLFFDALATLSATDPYPTDAAILAARDTLLHCSRRIRSARLFSPNEDWDDVATSNLPLLLTDAYLADAEARVRTSSPRDRRAALLRVVGHWHAYLTIASRFGLASPGDVAMADVASFGMDQISGGGTGGNAATRRNEKIARFKAGKERQARMASLNETLAAAAQRKAIASHRPMLPASFLASVTSGFSSLAPREATPSTGGNKYITRSGDGDGVDDDDFDDDEVLSRDFVKLLMTHWVDKAKDELEMVRDELPMVERMIQATEAAAASAGVDGGRDPQRNRGRNEDDLASRLDGVRLGGAPAGNGLLDAQGRPMRPFTLVSQRAIEQGKVFRPSHRLPTMSIEEYIDAEMERGGILPKQDPNDQKQDSDSDDDEVADRRTYKKREWDAFTDDNPRGAGNRNWNRG
ncbi:TAP42-like protein, partial [Catenaria anguillulae PL171]